MDKSKNLSGAYKVQAMPTFLVLKDKWNNVVETIVGGGNHNVDRVYEIAQNQLKK